MTTPSENQPMIQKIGQIAVPVTDLQRAVEFYRDTLGLPFLFQTPPGLAFFSCGEVRLLLDAAVEPTAERYSSLIYFQVEKIYTACKTIESRGVVLEQPPHLIASMDTHDLWMAFFRDPDGNLLGLMCELPPGSALA
jgi:methylmalonyl-CoA/ethylmalonyl-CoA epimerase